MNTTESKPIVTRAADKKYLACGCAHSYFDKTFGATIRPHNPCAKRDTFRCVVCGALATAN